jgi:delta8-fatty-acid desaturase
MAVSKRETVLSRRVIEGMIAEGHTVVVYNGNVLRLDRWLEKHPGGKLPLLHMIGNDATSEIEA